jgi:hypothetical protein
LFTRSQRALSFQAQLIGNHSLDNGTLEEARIVARVQDGGAGERERAKIAFGDEARSERQLATVRSGLLARREQNTWFEFLMHTRHHGSVANSRG